MGLARKVVRRAVRRSVPRSVWRATHPISTAKRALTPKPVRTAKRAVYTVVHPVSAAQSKVVNYMYSTPAKGRSRSGSGASSGQSRTYPSQVSGSGVRAEEAVRSVNQLNALLQLRELRYAPAQREVLIAPAPVDPRSYFQQYWRESKRAVPFWKFADRRALRERTLESARSAAERRTLELRLAHDFEQRKVDVLWEALLAGETETLGQALRQRFQQEHRQISISALSDTSVSFALRLPTIDVVPAKKAHITPTGRLSSKAWTKSELNQVYADVIAAALMSAIRIAWAAGPSLQELRVTGMASASDVLFDVTIDRQRFDASNDSSAELLLASAERGVRRMGATKAITPWSA